MITKYAAGARGNMSAIVSGGRQQGDGMMSGRAEGGLGDSAQHKTTARPTAIVPVAGAPPRAPRATGSGGTVISQIGGGSSDGSVGGYGNSLLGRKRQVRSNI